MPSKNKNKNARGRGMKKKKKKQRENAKKSEKSKDVSKLNWRLVGLRKLQLLERNKRRKRQKLKGGNLKRRRKG